MKKIFAVGCLLFLLISFLPEGKANANTDASLQVLFSPNGADEKLLYHTTKISVFLMAADGTIISNPWFEGKYMWTQSSSWPTSGTWNNFNSSSNPKTVTSPKTQQNSWYLHVEVRSDGVYYKRTSNAFKNGAYAAIKPAGSANYNQQWLNLSNFYYIYTKSDYYHTLSKDPAWLASKGVSQSYYKVKLKKVKIYGDSQTYDYYKTYGKLPSSADKILLYNYYSPDFHIILCTHSPQTLRVSPNFLAWEFADREAPRGHSWAIDYNLVRDLQNIRTYAGRSVYAVNSTTSKRGYRYNSYSRDSNHQWGIAIDFHVYQWSYATTINNVLIPYKEQANNGTGWNFTRIGGGYMGSQTLHIDTDTNIESMNPKTSTARTSMNPYPYTSDNKNVKSEIGWNGSTSKLTRNEY